MMNIQKRFIAGATCPQCQLIDKIVIYQHNTQEIAECVRCHWQQEQTSQLAPKILATTPASAALTTQHSSVKSSATVEQRVQKITFVRKKSH